jgi:hypothetical protein
MVQAFCDECSVPHPTGIVIERNELLSPEQRAGDVYEGRELPAEIVTMTSNYFQCRNTGKMFRQRDNDRVYLVLLP